jgi:hypothetical protein
MKNQSELSIAKKLIIKEFSFLEEQGFERFSKIRRSNVFINSLDVEYRNLDRQRKICISYTKGKVFEEIKYSFTLSIYRIPYVDVEDFFSLPAYLTSIDKVF